MQSIWQQISQYREKWRQNELKRRAVFSNSLSYCDAPDRFPCEQFKLKTNANDPQHTGSDLFKQIVTECKTPPITSRLHVGIVLKSRAHLPCGWSPWWGKKIEQFLCVSTEICTFINTPYIFLVIWMYRFPEITSASGNVLKVMTIKLK